MGGMRFLLAITALTASATATACTAMGVPSLAGADGASSSSSSTSSSESSLAPLSLGMSIHVEGYDEHRVPEAYAPHLAQVRQVATEASEEGGVLTFELDRSFTTAAIANGETFIADLDDLGQGVGVHADLGGTPIADAVYVSRLTDHKADVESLLDPGDVVTTVSGVCSTGRWVENVMAAGMFAASGSVEWCLKSLDSIPEDHGYDIAAIDACTRPHDCHGQAPTDWEHKLHPWPATTSTDWLTPSADGAGLWLLAGEGGTAIHCLGESAGGEDVRDCEPDDGDVAAVRRSRAGVRRPAGAEPVQQPEPVMVHRLAGACGGRPVAGRLGERPRGRRARRVEDARRPRRRRRVVRAGGDHDD